MEKKLLIKNPDEFLKFLDCNSKISDSSILEVASDKISSLASSADNTLILHSEYTADTGFDDTLNIPDLKKLYRVIDTIQSEDITLQVNTNNIEYNGSGIKFKYHLFDEGFLSKPNLNLEKINSFKFDVTFNINKDTIQQVFKGSTFASETNKLYFYTDNGNIMAELTDKARHNTDKFSISLGKADFNLKPIPVNFDNIRLLSIINNDINVSINTEYGVIIFDIEQNNIKLKYIISALTQ
jgi:hypothetical protein|tara:strand:- start:1634 stop:2353 length:720 start_codon:yes stop_codon:yes gene_type:complete